MITLCDVLQKCKVERGNWSTKKCRKEVKSLDIAGSEIQITKIIEEKASCGSIDTAAI